MEFEMLLLTPSFLIGIAGLIVVSRGSKKYPRGLSIKDVWRIVEPLDVVRLVLCVIAGASNAWTGFLCESEQSDLIYLLAASVDTFFWPFVVTYWIVQEISFGLNETHLLRVFALLQVIGEGLILWFEVKPSGKEDMMGHSICLSSRLVAKFLVCLALVCFNRNCEILRVELRRIQTSDSLDQRLMEDGASQNEEILESLELAEAEILWKSTQPACPEEQAGMLSQIFYFWLNPLINLGYSKTLDKSDLLRPNEAEEAGRVGGALLATFKEELMKREAKEYNYAAEYAPLGESDDDGVDGSEEEEGSSKEDKRGEKKGDLWLLVRAFYKSGILEDFYFAGVMEFIRVILELFSPILLKEIITFLQTPKSPMSHGLLFVGLLTGNVILKVVVEQRFFHYAFRVGIRVHSALSLCVFEKSLLLTPTERQKRTTGQIVNLMSTDCERVEDVFFNLHKLWSNPLQVFLTMFLLWQQIKYSAMIALAVLLVLVTPLSMFVSRKVDAIQEEIMELKDERVRVTSEVLSSIKVLKMYGWVSSFKHRIMTHRHREVQTLKRFALFMAGAFVCWMATPMVLTLISFGTFALFEGSLDPASTMASLSLLNSLEFPLSGIPAVLSYLFQSLVSFRRLSWFFESEEIDQRLINSVHDGAVPEADISIQVSSGTFFWDDERKNVALRDINFRIQTGSLCIVTGEVGSGKTALLSMLTDQLQPERNPLPRVGVRGKVGYASQSPWIQNMSVKENILFGAAFNEVWYRKVVHACSLHQDFNQLPRGDGTLIGERGINLSGGQKARIALARAVYSTAEILLLETCFEAVDEHVAEHLWQHCIQGILKEPHPVTNKVRTVVLVTHALRFAKDADQIIIMKNGTVSEQGSYLEVISNPDSEFKRLSQHSGQNQGMKEIREKEPLGETEGTRSDVNPENKITFLTTEEPEMAEENQVTGSVQWHVFIGYGRDLGGWSALLLILIVLVFRVSSETLATVWIAIWSSKANKGEPLTNEVFLGVYGALTAGTLLTTGALVVVVLVAGIRASRQIHDNMLSAVLHAPMSFFDTNPLGRMLNRFSDDMNQIDSVVPHIILEFIQALGVMFAPIIIAATAAPLFLLFLPFLAVAFMIVQRYYVNTSRQLRRWRSVLSSPVYSHFTETLDGVSTIRAFDDSWRASSTNRIRMNMFQGTSYIKLATNRWLAVRLETIGALLIGAIAFSVVTLRDSADPAYGGMAITFILSFSFALSWVVSLTANLETDTVSIERTSEYTALSQEAPDIDPNPALVPPAGNWPTNGEIVFQDVFARYRPELDPVLKGVSLSIRPFEKVGIVGRTGSGKSTLFSLLLRLVEPENGQVLIDGYDLQLFGLERLRQSCAIIPQDPVMFSGTIRENIDPLRNHSENQIWDALDHAQMRSHVESLENQLDTQIEEGGSNFSFGQRQLVCIARAILRKAPIVLCDEATSGIDNATDNLVHSTIRREFKSSTVLTIAHRLGTIMESDRVLVMDDGKVAEFDTPAVLLDSKDSKFYKLVHESH